MLARLTPILLLAAIVGCNTAAPHAPATQVTGSAEPVGEIRRGVVMEGTPEERGRRSMERIVRKIEPSLRGDRGRLPQYVAFYKREFVQDLRTFAFDASAEAGRRGTVVVTGYAEYPEQREALEQFLRFLGFDKIDNRIQQLPAKDLGDRPFALVKVPHTTIYDRPDKPRENVSQSLLGDPLFLLMASGDYYLCHTAEGYVGYVAAADVLRVTAAELSDSQALPRATVTVTTTAGGPPLPAGAHFKLVKSDSATSTVRVPGAGEVVVPSAAVTVTDERAALARVAPVIAAARTFMGTKYVWGGKSLDGIDCSGLVQTSFQTQGVRLPRDADQQGYVGQLVATRWHRADLRPGDTLYFLNRTGRIHHTALYIGNHEYIEAANPGVKVTSFDPATPNYDAKRDASFCFAKRILD